MVGGTAHGSPSARRRIAPLSTFPDRVFGSCETMTADLNDATAPIESRHTGNNLRDNDLSRPRDSRLQNDETDRDASFDGI